MSVKIVKENHTEGTIVKQSDGSLYLHKSSGEGEVISEDDILDSTKYKVKRAYHNTQSLKVQRRKKRKRKLEQELKEKELKEHAGEKRHESDLEEYNKLTKAFQGGYMNFEYFKKLVERLRAPFVTDIDGTTVALDKENNCSVMLRQSALEHITNKIFIDPAASIPGNQTKKQKRSVAVSTVFGATGTEALQQAIARDARLEQEKNTKERRAIKREKENAKKAIQLAVERRRKEPDDYWKISEKATDHFTMFLRLFSPACDKLSKEPEEQWLVVKELKITKLSFDAKVEELELRVDEIEATERVCQKE